MAKKVALEEDFSKKLALTDVEDILGAPRYIKDKYQGNEFAGSILIGIHV